MAVAGSPKPWSAGSNPAAPARFAAYRGGKADLISQSTEFEPLMRHQVHTTRYASSFGVRWKPLKPRLIGDKAGKVLWGIASAVRRGLINPGERQISATGRIDTFIPYQCKRGRVGYAPDS